MKAVSCNGCRILRKGCPQDCPIRQCLLGFDSSDSQANATLFLANFYGRSGLCNLIKACHESQRHSLFRSLLYESCGRILNPVYGSLGLLYSGDWLQCVAAVRSVLEGSFTADENTNGTESIQIPLAGCDIRHVSNKSILPMKKYRKASNTMRPKRAAPEIGGDVSTGTSTEDEARPTMANKRKLNDLFEEEEIEEQESELHRPSTLNLNLASPANQEKLDDQWDDDINLKLSLRRTVEVFGETFDCSRNCSTS